MTKINHSGGLLLNIIGVICLFLIFVLLLLFITWEECSSLVLFYYLEMLFHERVIKKQTPGQFVLLVGSLEQVLEVLLCFIALYWI